MTKFTLTDRLQVNDNNLEPFLEVLKCQFLKLQRDLPAQ